jgi:hypothetical protein
MTCAPDAKAGAVVDASVTRAARGFVIALGWTIGLAAIAPTLAAVFGLVAYSIWNGRHRLEARAAAPLS